ncbi:unnamed protein product [Urochloa humidicola]
MHCRGEFISRLSLSTSTYRVIKSPIDLAECHEGEDTQLLSSIGKSGNRVCFASLDEMGQLRVWMLNEPGDQTEWLLKHCSVLNLRYKEMRGDGAWTLDAYNKNDSETEGDEKVSQGHKRDWNSDDDSITDIEEEDIWFQRHDDFLGFHPYREVIFLRGSGNSAVAYHLNSKKAQYLGDLGPRCYNRGLFDSFLYTPCLIGV